MSDRPTSFHDFHWACGHTGPGYCSRCRDAQVEEARVALELAQERYRKLAASLSYEKEGKTISPAARIEQLEADIKTILTLVQTTNKNMQKWSKNRGFRKGNKYYQYDKNL